MSNQKGEKELEDAGKAVASMIVESMATLLGCEKEEVHLREADEDETVDYQHLSLGQVPYWGLVDHHSYGEAEKDWSLYSGEERNSYGIVAYNRDAARMWLPMIVLINMVHNFSDVMLEMAMVHSNMLFWQIAGPWRPVVTLYNLSRFFGWSGVVDAHRWGKLRIPYLSNKELAEFVNQNNLDASWHMSESSKRSMLEKVWTRTPVLRGRRSIQAWVLAMFLLVGVSSMVEVGAQSGPDWVMQHHLGTQVQMCLPGKYVIEDFRDESVEGVDWRKIRLLVEKTLDEARKDASDWVFRMYGLTSESVHTFTGSWRQCLSEGVEQFATLVMEYWRSDIFYYTLIIVGLPLGCWSVVWVLCYVRNYVSNTEGYLIMREFVIYGYYWLNYYLYPFICLVRFWYCLIHYGVMPLVWLIRMVLWFTNGVVDLEDDFIWVTKVSGGKTYFNVKRGLKRGKYAIVNAAFTERGGREARVNSTSEIYSVAHKLWFKSEVRIRTALSHGKFVVGRAIKVGQTADAVIWVTPTHVWCQMLEINSPKIWLDRVLLDNDALRPIVHVVEADLTVFKSPLVGFGSIPTAKVSKRRDITSVAMNVWFEGEYAVENDTYKQTCGKVTQILGVANEVLTHNITTEEGYSGGAIFDSDGNWVAMHQGFCRFEGKDERCYQVLNRGMMAHAIMYLVRKFEECGREAAIVESYNAALVQSLMHLDERYLGVGKNVLTATYRLPMKKEMRHGAMVLVPDREKLDLQMSKPIDPTVVNRNREWGDEAEYGVVYTPKQLSDFIKRRKLLIEAYITAKDKVVRTPDELEKAKGKVKDAIVDISRAAQSKVSFDINSQAAYSQQVKKELGVPTGSKPIDSAPLGTTLEEVLRKKREIVALERKLRNQGHRVEEDDEPFLDEEYSFSDEEMDADYDDEGVGDGEDEIWSDEKYSYPIEEVRLEEEDYEELEGTAWGGKFEENERGLEAKKVPKEETLAQYNDRVLTTEDVAKFVLKTQGVNSIQITPIAGSESTQVKVTYEDGLSGTWINLKDGTLYYPSHWNTERLQEWNKMHKPAGVPEAPPMTKWKEQIAIEAQKRHTKLVGSAELRGKLEGAYLVKREGYAGKVDVETLELDKQKLKAKPKRVVEDIKIPGGKLVWPPLDCEAELKSLNVHWDLHIQSRKGDERKVIDEAIIDRIIDCIGSETLAALRKTAIQKDVKKEEFVEGFKEWLKSPGFSKVHDKGVGRVPSTLSGATKGVVAGRVVNDNLVVLNQMKNQEFVDEVWKVVESIQTGTKYEVILDLFIKPEPHPVEKIEAGRFRIVQNPAAQLTTLGMYLFKYLNETAILDLSLNTCDLDHIDQGKFMAKKFPKGWHDVDVSHLDWSTTLFDLKVHEAIFRRIYGPDSLQVKLTNLYKGIEGNWEVKYALSDGRMFIPGVMGRVDSGEWVTLWRNNLTMWYAHLHALKECGYCKHDKSIATCRGKMCVAATFMGDDGAVDKRIVGELVTPEKYKESFKRCGKKLKWDEDKSYCSRELRTVDPGQIHPMLGKNKVKVLQNIKLEKSLAKLYVSLRKNGEVGENSHKYLSARDSFFYNFAFANWQEVEEKWAEFQLPPWNEATMTALRLKGAADRMGDKARLCFPIEYADVQEREMRSRE